MEIKLLDKFCKTNKNHNLRTKDEVMKRRQIIISICDMITIFFAFFISISIVMKKLYFDSIIIGPLVLSILVSIFLLAYFNCYFTLWTGGIEKDIISIFIALTLSIMVEAVVNIALEFNFSLDFFIVYGLISLVGICGVRILYRVIRRNRQYVKVNNIDSSSKVLIVGAGVAGHLILQELFENPELKKLPVAIVDDDERKVGRTYYTGPILGTTKEITKIVEEKQIDEIIFSIARIDKKKKRDILEICKSTDCKVRTIPGIYELIDGKVSIKKIRDVNIEDLLGRATIEIEDEEVAKYIKNKRVLVTGGGGSIGSELCRQIAKLSPSHLIIVDIYENNAYSIQQELIRNLGDKLNLTVLISSIRDKNKIDSIFETYKPEIVFHAAAHKHVPLMEDSPCEAIKNNIFGTINVAEISLKYKVQRFILISTDKAVNPTNIMGATKRCCEMIIQILNKYSDTQFVAVRFGNVLGSNGSVVPLFKKQIEEGGPVRVTHPEITRFFMTIREAVSLVLEAGAIANGGEIFVLNMGEPVKILDLAKNLIMLSGFEPNVDIKIEFTGLRPGEKLYEEILMDEEDLKSTTKDKIFIARPIEIDEEFLCNKLKYLQKAAEDENNEQVKSMLKLIVPTYIVKKEGESDEAAISLSE